MTNSIRHLGKGHVTAIDIDEEYPDKVRIRQALGGEFERTDWLSVKVIDQEVIEAEKKLEFWKQVRRTADLIKVDPA